MNEGFLGTAALRYADVVVLLEIGMGVALLIGAVLARLQGQATRDAVQSLSTAFNSSS